MKSVSSHASRMEGNTMAVCEVPENEFIHVLKHSKFCNQ